MEENAVATPSSQEEPLLFLFPDTIDHRFQRTEAKELHARESEMGNPSPKSRPEEKERIDENFTNLPTVGNHRHQFSVPQFKTAALIYGCVSSHPSIAHGRVLWKY